MRLALTVPGEPRGPAEVSMDESTRSEAPNIFPEIIYDDAPAAIAWLSRAFGFVLGERIDAPDGAVIHAEMHLGPGTIMLKSPVRREEHGMAPSDFGQSPRTLGGISHTLYVAVPDPDAQFQRACPRPDGAE
jgi:PhnB protein